MRGGKVEIDIDLDTKSFDAQIEQTEAKLKELEHLYSAALQAKGKSKESEEAIRELREEIEKTSNKLVTLKQQQTKMETSGTNSWNNIGNAIKKVGLKMFGLASIYGIVSKASSAYLSKDTELAEKMQNTWANLGAFLAPAIEFIVDITAKAVGYLNAFITALTGVDLIARANAKALNKQAQAQKKLNNQMYDFDVIRTQQEESDTGVSTGGSAMFETPELNEDLVNSIKDIAKAVKGLFEFFVKPFDELNKETKEFEKALNDETHMVESNTQGIRNWTEAYWENNKAGNANIETDNLMRNSLKTTSVYIKDQIEDIQKQRKQWFLTKTAKQELINQETEYAKELSVVNGNYKMLYEQQLLTDDATKDYIESLKTQIAVAKDLGFETGYLEEQLSNLENKKYTAKVEVDVDISAVDRTISVVSQNLASAITAAFGVKQYAVGGLVTQPTRAIIGEAGYNEYVIPEREDYIARLAGLINQHGGSGTTNVYLDGRLIQRQVSDRQSQYDFATNR